MNRDVGKLTRAERQALIAESLCRAPELSDREHGRQIGVDHKTVAVVRARLVETYEIPHVVVRTDSLGRDCPVTTAPGPTHDDDPIGMTGIARGTTWGTFHPLLAQLEGGYPDHLQGLAESRRRIGHIYPVLIHPSGWIFDGTQRRRIDPAWPGTVGTGPQFNDDGEPLDAYHEVLVLYLEANYWWLEHGRYTDKGETKVRTLRRERTEEIELILGELRAVNAGGWLSEKLIGTTTP
jgi:hypothetical protein